MKITKQDLKRIIKEEIQKVMYESNGLPGNYHEPVRDTDYSHSNFPKKYIDMEKELLEEPKVPEKIKELIKSRDQAQKNHGYFMLDSIIEPQLRTKYEYLFTMNELIERWVAILHEIPDDIEVKLSFGHDNWFSGMGIHSSQFNTKTGNHTTSAGSAFTQIAHIKNYNLPHKAILHSKNQKSLESFGDQMVEELRLKYMTDTLQIGHEQDPDTGEFWPVFSDKPEDTVIQRAIPVNNEQSVFKSDLYYGWDFQNEYLTDN